MFSVSLKDNNISILRKNAKYKLFSFFQVPFIAFYRKEYVEPELNINDLWKVWQWDEKVQFDYCLWKDIVVSKDERVDILCAQPILIQGVLKSIKS